MLIDDILINNSFGNRIKESFIKKHYYYEYLKIVKFSNDYNFENLKWTNKVYNYIFNIIEIPKCKCGKNSIFKGRINKIYSKYCSNKCTAFYEKDKKLNTLKNNNLKKYNVENVFQLESIKNKIKNTNIERYGFNNPNNSEKIKDKIKKTNIDKYGFDSYMKTEEFKNKSKNTNIEKYGVDHPMKNENVKDKLEKTLIEKYGVNRYAKTEEYMVQKIHFNQMMLKIK